jgi:hypothetical protein
LIKIKELNKNILKEVFSNTAGLNDFTICAFVEGEEAYTKITSFLSQRAKNRFDINYNILKYKKFQTSEIEQAYKNIEDSAQAFMHLQDKEELEYSAQQNHNESDEPSSFEAYLSFYINCDAIRYENLNIYLDGVINENSFELISDIELLFKVKSLKKEAFEYENSIDYVNYQLLNILEREENSLFQNIFESVLNKTILCEDDYDNIFETYQKNLLKDFDDKFNSIRHFMQNIYNKNYKTKNLKKRKIYNSLEVYSPDEFKDFLDFYSMQIKKEGLLNAEEYLMDEKSKYIKYLFDDYIFSGMRLEQFDSFIEVEKEALFKELKKKILIIKFGLKKYISKMCVIELSKSAYFYEKELELLFDKEIREELFEYVSR